MSLTPCLVLKPDSIVRTEVSEEARRIENLIRSVTENLADPQTSLGEAVRLGDLRKKLEAYLDGIRFALGEKPYAPMNRLEA
jgi:hypothetical protein